MLLAAPQVSAQSKSWHGFELKWDALARQEWTEELAFQPTPDRWMLRLRPALEFGTDQIHLGVGGDFIYSKDKNYEPKPVVARDNYRSRDARLDLAYGKVKLGPLVAQGGRFFMPIPFTEMIWDRDLRPQGGAVALQYASKTSASRFALEGIYATGSHVYEDESVMYGGALNLTFAAGQESSLQLVGAYLQFEDLEKLQPQVRRQNTRVAGLFVHDYHVVDLIARIRRGGQVPLELVANYAWNTAVNQNGHGLWLAAVLGNVGVSRASLAYTYAKVDKDATVAAFNTDDFFWGTGWEGHRLDLATGTVKSSSVHGIAQKQRFKDSPDATIASQWVTRYRLEWRTSF